MNPFRAGYSYTDRLNNKCLLTRGCPAQEDLHPCITSLDNCPSSQHLLLKPFSGPLEKVSGTWLSEVSDAFRWSSNICPGACAESVRHTSITLANQSFFSSVIQNWNINFYAKKEQRRTKDLQHCSARGPSGSHTTSWFRAFLSPCSQWRPKTPRIFFLLPSDELMFLIIVHWSESGTTKHCSTLRPLAEGTRKVTNWQWEWT